MTNEDIKARDILIDQIIRYEDAEYKHYAAMHTLQFIERFLGKESIHYDAIKSFTMPNAYPDTSDSLWEIKMKNTNRRFLVCMDNAINTIEKVGIFKNQSLEELKNDLTKTPNIKHANARAYSLCKNWLAKHASDIIKSILIGCVLIFIAWYSSCNGDRP